MKKLIIVAVAICVISAAAQAQVHKPAVQNQIKLGVENHPWIVAADLGDAQVEWIQGFGEEKTFAVTLPKAKAAKNGYIFAYSNTQMDIWFSYEPFTREEINYGTGSPVTDVLHTKFEMFVHWIDNNNNNANANRQFGTLGWNKVPGVTKKYKVNNGNVNGHPHDGMVRANMNFMVRTPAHTKFVFDDGSSSPDAGLYETIVYIDYVARPFVK